MYWPACESPYYVLTKSGRQGARWTQFGTGALSPMATEREHIGATISIEMYAALVKKVGGKDHVTDFVRLTVASAIGYNLASEPEVKKGKPSIYTGLSKEDEAKARAETDAQTKIDKARNAAANAAKYRTR
jgi:hypothetical protein